MELREVEDDERPRAAARVVLFAALVLFVVAAVVGVVLVRTSGNEEHGATWDDWSTTPGGLQVHGTRGGCERVSRVDVEETSDRVVVTLHLEVVALMCDAAQHDVDEPVTLDGPLGSRPVYDGSCLTTDRADGECERFEAQSAR